MAPWTLSKAWAHKVYEDDARPDARVWMNEGSGAFTLIERFYLVSRPGLEPVPSLLPTSTMMAIRSDPGGHAGCVQDNRQGVYNSFYLGIGNGSFTEVSGTAQYDWRASQYSMAIGIADFIADGNMDVFFGNQEGCNSAPANVTTFFGDGAASFTEVHGSANDGTALYDRRLSKREQQSARV